MGVYYCHYLIPRDNTMRPEPDRIAMLIGAWLAQGFVLPQQNFPEQQQHQPDTGTAAVGGRFITRPPFGRPTEYSEAAQPRPGFWARLLGQRPEPGAPDPWTPFLFPPIGETLSALARTNTIIEWNAHPDALYPMQTVPQSRDIPSPNVTIDISEDFMNPSTDPYGTSDGVPAKQIAGICRCGHDLAYQDEDGRFAGSRIRRVCPACGLAFRPQEQLAELVDDATGNRIPQPGGLCYRFAIILDFGKELPVYANGELVESKPKVTDLFMNTCTAALGVELNEFGYYY
ncbi:MAG: hypothetical protein K2Y71_09645 [Xanthobacteraceae bacterium]|nr:hypothetical protein [Xanthobacteraceae bacterium]